MTATSITSFCLFMILAPQKLLDSWIWTVRIGYNKKLKKLSSKAIQSWIFSSKPGKDLEIIRPTQWLRPNQLKNNCISIILQRRTSFQRSRNILKNWNLRGMSIHSSPMMKPKNYTVTSQVLFPLKYFLLKLKPEFLFRFAPFRTATSCHWSEEKGKIIAFMKNSLLRNEASF